VHPRTHGVDDRRVAVHTRVLTYVGMD
jgi:hypothetical protein